MCRNHARASENAGGHVTIVAYRPVTDHALRHATSDWLSASIVVAGTAREGTEGKAFEVTRVLRNPVARPAVRKLAREPAAEMIAGGCPAVRDTWRAHRSCEAESSRTEVLRIELADSQVPLRVPKFQSIFRSPVATYVTQPSLTGTPLMPSILVATVPIASPA